MIHTDMMQGIMDPALTRIDLTLTMLGLDHPEQLLK